MKKFVFFLVALFSLNVAFGQVTIWTEDFESYVLDTGIDGNGDQGDYPAGVSKWTLDVSNGHLSGSYDYFMVKSVSSSKRLVTQDVDGNVVWLSQSINISEYTDVFINIDLTEGGSLESDDFYRCEYSVDGGAWTTFATNGYDNDDFTSATAEQTGLNGSALKIRMTFNNDAGGEYLNADNVVVKGTTGAACVAPTAQPTSFSFDFITHNSIDASFTDSSPAASGYLVVRSVNNSLTSNPVDGTVYAAGDALGGGNVVQLSPSTSFVDTGLSSLTTYYYYVFSYSSSCTGGPMYYTTSPLEDNDTTLDVPCVGEESFEGSWPPAGWSQTGVYQGSTASNARTGSKYAGFNDTGDILQLPDVDNPATLVYYARLSSSPSGSNKIKIQYFNGVTWSDIVEHTATTTSYERFTADLSTLTGLTGVQLRFYRSADNRSHYIDDVSVYCSATTPTITVNPTSLSGYSYGVGDGPSDEQSFVISGTNLTNDISISPDANWEISLTSDSGGTFSATDPITLTPSGGDVANTPIYTRLKAGLAIGVYSENVTATSVGASDVDVAVSGDVYEPCVQLIISEYASVIGGNYVEIYNPSNVNIDLSDYQLWRGLNGGSWGSADIIALSGTLAFGDVYVIARDASEIPYADLYSADMDYNGDDNIGLAYDDGGGTFVLIDAVGDENGDPGTAWEVAGVADATVDYTMVRKTTVDRPNTDWVASAGVDATTSEWTVLAYTTDNLMYHVSDCLLIPIMAVFGDDNIVIIGSTTTTNPDNLTMFPDTPNGSTISHTFDIYNVGNTDLDLTGAPDLVSISGGDFSITTAPTTPVGSFGGTTSFVIEFAPASVGTQTAVVSIPNNNPFEDPYTFTIKGTGYMPCSQLIISAYGNQNDPGGNYVSIYNPTAAIVDLSDYEIWRGYNGGAWTSAATISLSGSLSPGDIYTVVKSFSEHIAVEQEDADFDYNGNDNVGLAFDDGSGTFVLIDAVGDEDGNPGIGWDVAGVVDATEGHKLLRKSTIDKPNTDWEASRGVDAASSEWVVEDFDRKGTIFHVSDCVATPIMLMFDDDMEGYIPNGWTTPEEWNNTIFPKTKVGGLSRSNVYNVVNAGNTQLNLTAVGDLVTVSGPNAADFTVTAMPSTPLAVGPAFSDFTIEFNPSDYGTRSATITIENDCDFENPYVFDIEGEGVNYEICDTQDTQLIFEDFEDATVGYTLSEPEYVTSSYDYFTRTDGGNIGGDVVYSNIQDTSYFGAQDTDSANTGSDILNVEFYDIDITGATNLDFSIFIAEDDDGGNQDWDADTALHIDYRIDGGAWQHLIWVEATNGGNSEPALDLDFNGVGDLGEEITDEFREIHASIEETGSVLDIDIEFRYLDAGDEDIAIDNVELFGNSPVMTTWDGIGWTNGTPTETTKAVFEAFYDFAAYGDIEACSCRVEDMLSIPDGNALIIGSDIINNNVIEVANEASVIQYNKDAAVIGNGIYKLNKTTTAYHEYDYTYWSSPSINADLVDTFVPIGNPDIADFIWTMNTGNMDGVATDGDDWDAAAGIMSPGLGYAVLGDDADLPFDENTGTWSNGNTDDITFEGPFNNGDIDVQVVIDGDLSDGFNNQNLIGNPYPSAIDMTLFYNANDAVLGPNFHFWTHNTVISSGASGSHAYNFTNNDYSTWNAGTGAVVGGSASGKTSNFIASAQGFIVEAADLDAGTPTGTITFTNDMRVTGDNDNFLSPRGADDNDEMNKFWLNLRSENDEFRQILVGFFDEATCGFDEMYDGPRMPNGNSLDFFSVIEGDSRHFAIQGMHTFDTTKIVVLGLEIVDPIAYQIEIDHLEGVFNDGQEMYLYDSYTSTIHNLADGPYSFTSDIGDPINDRLTVRFTDDTTGIGEWNTNTTLVVTQNEDNFEIRSSDQSIIKEVTLYNVLGQKMESRSSNTAIVVMSKGQYSLGTVLLMKVQLVNGEILTQKVISLN